MSFTSRSLGHVLLVASLAASAAACAAPPRDAAAPAPNPQAAPAPGAAANSAAPAAAQPSAAAFTKSVAPAALASQQHASSPPVVLDVRTPAEFAAGHVPGAINVQHDLIASRLPELAKYRDREVVLYCRSGRRAGMAAEVLRQHGFERLVHLEGDMPGWEAAGQAVEKP